MNISQESASNWLRSTASDPFGNNSSSNSTDSTEDSASPHVWDLRWFAVLSAPLLFGTIILPLATGPLIRGLCHSFVGLRMYWIVAIRVVMLLTVILFYLPFSSKTATTVLDALLISSTSLSFFYIWRKRGNWRHPRIVILTLSLIVLPALDMTDLTRYPIGLVAWALFFVGQTWNMLWSLFKPKKEAAKDG